MGAERRTDDVRADAGDGAQQPFPQQAPPPRSRKWLAITAALAVVVLAVTAAFAYLVIGFAAQKGPGKGRAVRLELGRSPEVQAVSASLAAEGLLDNAHLFRLYALAMGASDKLRTGVVMVRNNMTPRELLQRIATGFGTTAVRVTLPEGWNRFEMAERLQEWDITPSADFLSACEDRALLDELGISLPSAEGYLFPDTYQFRDQAPAKDVVRRLVRTALARLEPLLAAQAGSTALATLGLDRDGVVTLASIVEEEAARPAERPVIAGVFLNRLTDPLFKPRRLQADPTVAYGCLLQPTLSSCVAFDGKRVTRRMTSDTGNRYNTYRIEGLPPAPISNPGLSSLRAVLLPAQHGYLYFVAKGDGSHHFSADLSEHNQAVGRLRQLQ